jgi:murein L,D-transpeptidase YafK
MKHSIIYIFLTLVLITTDGLAQKIPSSARSRAAIARVKPYLEKTIKGAGFKWGAPIFIRIFKQSKELEVWLKDSSNFRLFDTYKICTWGWGGLGPKVKQGDGKAPEGFYFVRPRQMNPNSQFHLSFNLGYPNAYDRAHGRTGGALMVHGSCVSIGCYAMTDPVIEEIFTLIDASFRNGQQFFRVHIFPFKMTEENLKKHQDSEWISFWKNLKEGYDYFEKSKKPPDVSVKNKKYVFKP